MMDVSDGLLLDARRMAEASGCAVAIELDALPLSSAFVAERGQDLRRALFAATGGDDYALLAALPPELDPATLSLPDGTTISRIGRARRRRAVHLAHSAAASPSSCRRDWVLSTRAISDRGLSAPPMADRP